MTITRLSSNVPIATNKIPSKFYLNAIKTCWPNLGT